MNSALFRKSWRSQRGVSLVVVLLLLLVMTLLGLAVLRSTLLEEKMSANLYDRSLAFQGAESALRQAEVLVRDNARAGVTIGYDCSLPGRSCPVVPVNTYSGNVAGCAANDQNCWIDGTTQQAISAGAPQYYIEYFGKRDSTDTLSLGSSANANQYGGGGGVQLESFYRITARSSDPAQAADRALVVLKSNIVVK
ncbi:PilX N-terminal domain-containing pilus assembly protein [Stenotrophomonas sp. YIM B06876]|uniref:pilus assembly PilX family protein n=1 Tax=Stenotrophomonas sp. YIM B06876 TaxID=3060211 RepID=UPI002738DB3B|nr:PilX N-terminal domain-containing pilus assembly protein [Stenotrophomonas sp. YIM B06876]